MTEQPIRENFFDFHTSYHLIVRLTIFLLFISTIVLGQQSDFDLKKIKFKGLAFSTTKEIIIKSLGEGKKVEPNYECGFFANDQDGGPYYQLVYNDFNYIGSDKEKFLLEKVGFDVNGTIKMNYGDKLLSGQTTESDFVEMFGENIRDNYEKRGDRSTFLLYSKGSEDGALFIFEKGRLHNLSIGRPVDEGSQIASGFKKLDVDTNDTTLLWSFNDHQIQTYIHETTIIHHADYCSWNKRLRAIERRKRNN